MAKEIAGIDWHIVKLDNLPADMQLEKFSDKELLEVLKQCNYDQNKVCYIAADDFISREIAGELVLVPLDDLGENGMITFNETGAYLWKLLQKKRTSGDLVFELQREFDVSYDIADTDVKQFLENAIGCGMIEKV